MKKLILAALVAAMMAASAFIGYDYAIHTARIAGYYEENNTLVCYDITYGISDTYHYE